MKNNYTLISIDLSLKCTGYSIVKVNNNNYSLLDYGLIDTHKLSHPQSLIEIEKVLTDVITKYKPDYVSAEQMFSGANRQTGMSLANSHGVMQLVCAKFNLDIVYFSVMTAKSITLNGIKTKKADGTKKTGTEMKQEISDEIINIFGIDSFIKPYNLDITDAISLAITFIRLDGKPPEKKKKKKKSL